MAARCELQLLNEVCFVRVGVKPQGGSSPGAGLGLGLERSRRVVDLQELG